MSIRARVLYSFFVALLAFASWNAKATCTESGYQIFCTVSQAEGHTYVSGMTGRANNGCLANGSGPFDHVAYGTVNSTPPNASQAVLFICQNGSASSTWTLSWPVASVDCSNAQDYAPGNVTLWSTAASNDIAASGTVECYGPNSNCSYTMTYSSPAVFNMAYLRWSQPVGLVHTGTSCSSAPPTTMPGAKPPDTDHDGIPDSIDPYPNDPTNTPPINPTTPPATTSEPGNATGNDISQLGALVGSKLDMIETALSDIKTSGDRNSQNEVVALVNAQTAIQSMANGVVAAINGQGPNAAGGSTDMTATNALLTTANTNTANIKSNTDSLKPTGATPDPYADGGPTDATGVSQDIGSPTDSSSQLDQSGFGWSRACPANPTFSVFGHSYSIDMSNICSIGGVLGNLLVLLTLLAAARIATSSP